MKITIQKIILYTVLLVLMTANSIFAMRRDPAYRRQRPLVHHSPAYIAQAAALSKREQAQASKEKSIIINTPEPMSSREEGELLTREFELLIREKQLKEREVAKLNDEASEAYWLTYKIENLESDIKERAKKWADDEQLQRMREKAAEPADEPIHYDDPVIYLNCESHTQSEWDAIGRRQAEEYKERQEAEARGHYCTDRD